MKQYQNKTIGHQQHNIICSILSLILLQDTFLIEADTTEVLRYELKAAFSDTYKNSIRSNSLVTAILDISENSHIFKKAHGNMNIKHQLPMRSVFFSFCHWQGHIVWVRKAKRQRREIGRGREREWALGSVQEREESRSRSRSREPDLPKAKRRRLFKYTKTCCF